MYERELEGRVLSFGHAGILIQNSFVMYDRQTDSLWIHVTGRAYHGPLKGKQLNFMPSTVTNWKAWKRAFPHTLVLAGRRRGGFMGTYDGMNSSRGLGLSVMVKFKTRLYPFGELAKEPLVQETFQGAKLLVYYSEKERTAVAWRRSSGGKELTFRLSGENDSRGNRLLRDDETGSLWSWLTGEAVSGKLKGARLPKVSANPILNDRFEAFYPDSPIYRQKAK